MSSEQDAEEAVAALADRLGPEAFLRALYHLASRGAIHTHAAGITLTFLKDTP